MRIIIWLQRSSASENGMIQMGQLQIEAWWFETPSDARMYTQRSAISRSVCVVHGAEPSSLYGLETSWLDLRRWAVAPGCGCGSLFSAVVPGFGNTVAGIYNDSNDGLGLGAGTLGGAGDVRHWTGTTCTTVSAGCWVFGSVWTLDASAVPLLVGCDKTDRVAGRSLRVRLRSRTG